jgi:hypothetical protein
MLAYQAHHPAQQYGIQIQAIRGAQNPAGKVLWGGDVLPFDEADGSVLHLLPRRGDGFQTDSLSFCRFLFPQGSGGADNRLQGLRPAVANSTRSCRRILSFR